MKQLYLIIIVLMFLPSLIAIIGILYVLLDNPITKLINQLFIIMNVFIKKLKS